MGTISRFRHVMSANMNALLERAEDPSKMLAALIREMEDALGEARAAGAGLIRDRKRFEARIEQLEELKQEWDQRAEQAVRSGRDELARAAIASKARATEEQRQCERALSQASDSVARVDRDIAHLEARLAEARRRQQQIRRTPVEIVALRHQPSPADRKLADVMGRFERLEAQLDHLEARVEAFDLGARPFATLGAATDPAVEEELERLRARVAAANGAASA